MTKGESYTTILPPGSTLLTKECQRLTAGRILVRWQHEFVAVANSLRVQERVMVKSEIGLVDNTKTDTESLTMKGKLATIFFCGHLGMSST